MLRLDLSSYEPDAGARHRRAEAIRFDDRPKAKRLLLLLASLAVFVTIGAGRWSGYDLILISAVVAFHEAGHAAGMLAFGYRDVSIFFLPGIGAATAGHKPSAPAWQSAVVSLLGPLPGIVLGLVLVVSASRFPAHPWLRRAAILLLVINYLNLLPFFPFDGGHFVNHLFLSRRHWLQTPFAVLGGVSFAALALWRRDLVLGFVAWLAFAAIPNTRRVQAVTEEAERNGWTDPANDDVVLGIDRLVAGEFPDVPDDRRPGLVRRVLSGLHVRPPGPVAMVLLLLVYLAPFALAAAATVRFGHSSHGRTVQGERAVDSRASTSSRGGAGR